MKKKQKKILYIFLYLTILQLIRIIYKSLVFVIVKRTLISDAISNVVFIGVMLYLVYKYIKKKKLDINLLPKKFNNYYIISTIFVILFMIITIVITKNYTVYALLSFIYNVILTVIYEEILFRGIVYNEVDKLYNEKYVFIISSIMFGLWHVGYIDTVMWRTSMFFNSANLFNIMFLKVITGIVLGLIFTFLRKRYKNVYSSSLMHALINTFGI